MQVKPVRTFFLRKKFLAIQVLFRAADKSTPSVAALFTLGGGIQYPPNSSLVLHLLDSLFMHTSLLSAGEFP